MKHLLCLLLTGVFSSILTGQTITPDPPARERKFIFGTDITLLASNLIGAKNAGNIQDEFTFRIGTTHSHFRMGLSYLTQQSTSTFSNPNVPDINNTNIFKGNALGWRLGYGFEIFTYKKFTTCMGLDALYSTASSRFTQTSANVQNSGRISKLTTIGAGPALDFQWRILPRVWLSTEISFYGTYDSSVQSTFFSNIPVPELNRTVNNFNWKFKIPRSLFVNVAF